jgi:HTH-type transcriptional regulator, sugar sensing transcriptional regulator
MKKELESLGLTEKEALLYMTLLKTGPATVLQLAIQTMIKRPTIYTNLKSLQSHGLVELHAVGLKTRYAAASPERLESMLRDKKRHLDTIFPELMGLHKLRGNKNVIKYYEGIEGVKTVYDNILREIRTNDPYYVIADQHNWETFDEEWFEDYLERKARRTLDARIIFKDSKIARRFEMMASAWKLNIKVTDRELDIAGDIVICPQRLILHNFTPPITAAVIEHPDIIQTHLNLFRFIWGMLPDPR